MKRLSAILLVMCLAASAPGLERGSGPGIPSAPPAAGPAEDKAFAEHLRSAEVLLERGFLDSAVAELLAALKLRPESVPALELFARTVLRMENWAATIATLRKLVRADPSNVATLRLLVDIASAYNMPIIEAAALEDLVHARPDDRAAWARLAYIRTSEIPSPVKAATCWRRLTDLDPTDVAAWKGLALALVAAGARDDVSWDWRDPASYLSFDLRERSLRGEILKAREALARLKPDDLSERLALASAYGNAGRWDRRAESLAELVRERPQDPALRGMLADAYGEQAEHSAGRGHHAAAWRALASAADLEPDSSEWPELSAELRGRLGRALAFAGEGGREGGVDFNRQKLAVELPLRRTETRLLAEGARRSATDASGTASAHLARLGARQAVFDGLSIEALAGPHERGGSYRAAVDWTDEALDLSVRRERDFLFENARVLAAGVAASVTTFEARSRHLRRLALNVEAAYTDLSGGNWREHYGWGVEAMVLEQRPFGHQAALIYRGDYYRHGASSGGLYFSEPHFRVRFLGARWRWASPRLAFSAEQLFSRDMAGVDGNMLSLSAECRVADALGITVGYAAGRFSGGPIAAAGAGAANDRRLSAGARLSW